MSTTAQNKQPKAVLLDMDGTLVDHFETICRCYQYASEQMGKTPPTYDQVKREVGGSMPVTIRRFFSDDELEEAKRHWNHRFDEIHLEGVILLKGARELLKALAGKVFEPLFSRTKAVRIRGISSSPWDSPTHSSSSSEPKIRRTASPRSNYRKSFSSDSALTRKTLSLSVTLLSTSIRLTVLE